MLVNRRVTRTILNSTESTAKTQSPKTDALTIALQTTDAFYVGYHEKFTTRFIQMSTVVNATASVLSAEYWDGSEWVAVGDFIDQTSNGTSTFSKSGFISWNSIAGWNKSNQAPVSGNLDKLYWLKLTTSANFTAGVLLQSLLDLYTDQEMLEFYYPDLANDSRFLPTGQADLVPQFLAASEWIADRMQKLGLINNKTAIIDPNEVSVAATHAAAWIIYNGISGKSQELLDAGKAAKDEAISQLQAKNMDLDTDNSGAVDDVERDIGHVYIARS